MGIFYSIFYLIYIYALCLYISTDGAYCPVWIAKCWSKTKNLCNPYIERCENSSRGLNWIAISTWTFLHLQVSVSCRKQGSWHGTVRSLQHRQRSKYWYLHFEDTTCMCTLTTNKVRELWQKSIFQQETHLKYWTVGNSTFLCIWPLSIWGSRDQH